jgi:hypothetical protein
MTRTPGMTRHAARVSHAGHAAATVALKMFIWITIGLFLGTVLTLILG